MKNITFLLWRWISATRPFPIVYLSDTFILKNWGSGMCDMEGGRDRDMFKNKKLDHIWVLFFGQNFLINIFFHANKSILTALFLITAYFLFVRKISHLLLDKNSVSKLCYCRQCSNDTLFIYWSPFHLLKHLWFSSDFYKPVCISHPIS